MRILLYNPTIVFCDRILQIIILDLDLVQFYLDRRFKYRSPSKKRSHLRPDYHMYPTSPMKLLIYTTLCIANPNQDCSHFPHYFMSSYGFLTHC